VGEFLREIAIVGEEEDTGGVAIQATDGKTRSWCVLDEMQDGFTALRVVGGGDVVFWFVEKDIDEVAGDGYFFPLT